MATRDTGAGAALKRLEDEESKTYSDLAHWKAELEKFHKDREAGKWADDADERTERARLESEINSAFEKWGKTAKLSLEFHKNVSPEDRDSGAKITQGQAVKFVAAILLAFDIADDGAIVAMSQDLIQMKKEAEIHEHATPIFKRSREELLIALIREEKIPAWLVPEIDAAV